MTNPEDRPGESTDRPGADPAEPRDPTPEPRADAIGPPQPNVPKDEDGIRFLDPPRVDPPRTPPRPIPDPAPLKPPAPPTTRPTPPLDIQVTIPNGMVGKPFDSLIALRVLQTTRLPKGYGPEDVALITRQVDGLEVVGLKARPDGPTMRVSGNPAEAGDHKIVVHFSVLLKGRHWATGQKTITLTINPDPRSLWKEKEPDAAQPFRREHLKHQRIAADAVMVAASRRGRSHANKGDHRDDDFRIEHSPEHGWHAMAVADGAGSAPLSRRGAEVACNAAIDSLAPHFATTLGPAFHQQIATSDDEAQPAIRDALYASLGHAGRAAYQAVVEEAAQLGKPAEHFATTLLLTVARKLDRGWFAAAIAIGDGGVGALGQNGVTILTKPDSGEFAGQTRFLTMPRIWADDADVRSRIDFAVVPDLVALVAMTDGVSDPMFPTERDFFDDARWQAFWADLSKEVSLDKANDKADQELLEWLGFWAVGSHDDRTIAILLP